MSVRVFLRKEEDRQGGEAQGKQRGTQTQVRNNQRLYNIWQRTHVVWGYSHVTFYFALPWGAALLKNSIMAGNNSTAKGECVSDFKLGS